MTVDVIIPVYKPDEKLLTIINKLGNQTVVPEKICLINTEEKYWENFLRGKSTALLGKNTEVRHVSLWEFDHGQTRNEGARTSTADLLLFMTQDAVPYDDNLIENLIGAFDNPKVAAAYARQIATADAPLSEQFSRQFNYPDESVVKSIKDRDTLGIKTYFCSNACAMYRREIFERLGRFPKNMIFNEDMVFAHTLIENGFEIAYCATAQVVHFHKYTYMQQFRRNFDLAVSQAMHPEVFEGVSSESEGVKYALSAFSYFKEKRRIFYFVPFALSCAFRLVAFKLGKNYKRLSHGQILRLTDSPRFFKKNWS